MANSIKLLFWLHRSKVNKDGLVPVIVRLTYQKQRVDKALGHYVDPRHWLVNKQRVKGTMQQSNVINESINNLLGRFHGLTRRDSDANTIHLPSIMKQLFATIVQEPSLLMLIRDYNAQLKERVGKGYSYSTYEKYVFTYNKVKSFIIGSLKMRDIFLRDVTVKFIMDFDHYLRVVEGNQHNTAVKYCINLKRVLNVALLQGIIDNNPLNAFKTVYKDTPQIYLSEAELKAIETVKLVMANHMLVRDLFIFQCHTGLAYTDLVNLQVSDISIDSSGRRWIIKERQKTGIISTIPVLTRAEEIIDKYMGHKRISVLFPSYAIQKYNVYIGEVGQLAGLQKKLSSHVGRRTFGNVALTRGISLNVISKILGHTNTIITQRIYAITTQQIISKEIEKW